MTIKREDDEAVDNIEDTDDDDIERDRIGGDTVVCDAKLDTVNEALSSGSEDDDDNDDDMRPVCVDKSRIELDGCGIDILKRLPVRDGSGAGVTAASNKATSEDAGMSDDEGDDKVLLEIDESLIVDEAGVIEALLSDDTVFEVDVRLGIGISSLLDGGVLVVGVGFPDCVGVL
ncbi:uncharacterized protein KY384_003420 [Bacidia gigantensis]|uniref:uncharacterized protein n=1 Tax=Bacidia gigantensis TaxID=2732470 RepID=UPI001D048AFA|nr:uncharacterized protein KY384_003420 [Bacidia gigantensis]KAG8531784.1 hypothetical protein KY384_003420 [Bacidia gigantensis]